ncbi:PIG-L family deacetylase [Paeniglutamicibacter antarcticus]|uniref:Methyltransferase domain-containing protein n=1 Tax=Paeniglutamicibacter antarcticus TaxID=494023 RepID=A0ABP9TKG0_9MICC
MVSFNHEDSGTSESSWQESGVGMLAAVPAIGMPCFGHPLLVLSAHPDDETLGAAGLIHQALRAGSPVHVIVATAGEASHPHSPTHRPSDLARIRALELAAALAALEPHIPDAGILTFEMLGFADGSLAEHTGKLEAALHTAVPAGDTLVVAPYRHDGHTDHDTLGALAARVAQELHLGLLEYPIWYWHWALPEQDARWTRWNSLVLDPEALAAKRRAMEMHRSQIAPLSGAPEDATLLHGPFLEHFERGSETFRFTAPGLQDSGTATTTFDSLYTRTPDPWHYLGSPYEERKRAVTIASLPKARYCTAMELGCSIGVLTGELAGRTDVLVAVDASGVALKAARERLTGMPHVTLVHAVLPHQFPDTAPGTQELVVVSEIGYFLAPDELDLLLGRCHEALAPGGHLLLCHWLHPVHGWPLDGEQVHAAAHRLGMDAKVLHREADFLLEIFEKTGGGDG